MYKIDVKDNEKLFFVKVGGFFKDEEAKQFLDEYLSKYESITPSEYDLVLDCKELSVSAQDMVPVLKERLEMYASQGFNRIFLVKMDSATGMMQLKRAGEESGFWGQITVVDTADEVEAVR
ncbi:hypothetical protein [Tenuibacillus multivorans]|uniref:STAS domain-containing protein n=1 Tax=Tenuibacillus multivorans TaxID=237069 RepID=A0A1H0ATF8_9BACI|nr:hypothetical protein [Tenuibacillus multivorans]GEL77826.1 hypothetical protein TMU01_20610 [Tenuibacillus multivorans]SDN36758.1 hypothetical protein SAMN05216498_2069 [Tenuibacillus multivorans]